MVKKMNDKTYWDKIVITKENIKKEAGKISSFYIIFFIRIYGQYCPGPIHKVQFPFLSFSQHLILAVTIPPQITFWASLFNSFAFFIDNDVEFVWFFKYSYLVQDNTFEIIFYSYPLFYGQNCPGPIQRIHFIRSS